MKPIKNYEKLYLINEDGRIWSNYSNKYISFSRNNSGYYVVHLHKNKKASNFLVHRLVALNYLSNTKNKEEVNHIDGDKTNNHFLNLEWCTSSENKKHAIKTGLIIPPAFPGETNPKAILNNMQVRIIKRILQMDTIKQIRIAEFFNINYRTISNIKNNKSWNCTV